MIWRFSAHLDGSAQRLVDVLMGQENRRQIVIGGAPQIYRLVEYD